MGRPPPWLSFLESALFFDVLAFVLPRFGRLAVIVVFTSLELPSACPPTLDIPAWYIGLVPIPLLAARSIVIYEFRASLAGRRSFQISGE